MLGWFNTYADCTLSTPMRCNALCYGKLVWFVWSGLVCMVMIVSLISHRLFHLCPTFSLSSVFAEVRANESRAEKKEKN